jgi:hypothetical protein
MNLICRLEKNKPEKEILKYLQNPITLLNRNEGHGFESGTIQLRSIAVTTSMCY